MSISVLNNISSLVAENAVSNTQNELQNTLQELATGLRINNGADDPAGLSIAEGLGSAISALNQSSQNVTNGIGLLQTADGALSQVTTILNQAVTIADEATNGNLSSSQTSALGTELTAIVNEINQIGSTTNFNGTSVFATTIPTWYSTQASLATSTALTNGKEVTIQDSLTGGTFVFTAGASSTISSLQTAVTNAVSAGTLSAGTSVAIGTGANAGQLEITTTASGDSLTVTSNDAVLGAFTGVPASGGGSVSTFTSDGTSTGSYTLTTSIGALSASSLSLNNLSLSTTAGAQSALEAITAAINTVSQNRGTIGASVNRLTADQGVEGTEIQNLTNAQNGVQNADIATVTSNLAQYNILEQTGFAALQQSQAAEQNVLKLIQ